MTAVVLTALLFWTGVFTIFLVAQGGTPLDFLFGRYEPLPGDLGTWRELPPSESGTAEELLREERFVLPGGSPSAKHLLHQVRYRDPLTRAIVRLEPERRVPRRRVRG